MVVTFTGLLSQHSSDSRENEKNCRLSALDPVLAGERRVQMFFDNEVAIKLFLINANGAKIIRERALLIILN